jgi:hypothetical protein
VLPCLHLRVSTSTSLQDLSSQCRDRKSSPVPVHCQPDQDDHLWLCPFTFFLPPLPDPPLQHGPSQPLIHGDCPQYMQDILVFSFLDCIVQSEPCSISLNRV